jgi:predicted methyltransferase MtxX (methanogen marker protein 4)
VGRQVFRSVGLLGTINSLHQALNQDLVLASTLICVLAYTLLKALRYKLSKKGVEI